MSKNSKAIQITVITDLSAFYALEKEWNALLSTIPDYTPTMTYYWQKTWLEINQDNILKLHIFTFRNQDGRLIGIIPLIHLKTEFLFRTLDVYTFSGARDQIKLCIICNREHQITILLEILNHFHKKHKDWDILALRRISSSHADEVLLERILRKYHFLFSIESHVRIPYILLDTDFPSYFQSRRKHFRHEIKRKSKKLEQLGPIRYDMIEAPLPPEQFNRFVELEHRSWKGRNGSSLKKKKHLFQMFQTLSEVNHPTIRMIQFSMYSAEKLISSSLCFKTSQGLHVFKIAYDETYRKYSPGLLLRLFEVEQAINMGLKIYDFSGTEQRWMHDFTNRKHHVMDYIVYRKTPIALVRFLGYTRLRPLIKRSHSLEAFLKNFVED